MHNYVHKYTCTKAYTYKSMHELKYYAFNVC